MTREEVKQLLSDISDMDNQIRSKELEIEMMKELAQSVHSSQMGSVPASKGSGNSYVEKAVIRYVDEERKLERERQELILKKQMIYRLIESVPNKKYRQVLRFRYLKGYCWKDIAEEVGCGIDNVYTIHRKAIDSILLDLLPKDA